jgi:hypothetical protein
VLYPHLHHRYLLGQPSPLAKESPHDFQHRPPQLQILARTPTGLERQLQYPFHFDQVISTYPDASTVMSCEKMTAWFLNLAEMVRTKLQERPPSVSPVPQQFENL